MTWRAVCGMAAGLAWVACSSARPAEVGEGPCSNGVDDDGDQLIDCADPACRLFPWCVIVPDAGALDAARAELNDAGARDAGDGEVGCGRPLDVVLTLDVSSSMSNDLARLVDLAPALFEVARQASYDSRISLVVFVDDAVAVDGCAPFSSAEALAASLAQWRAFSLENRSPVSRIANVDCAENSLDAVALAVTGCARRAGAAHVILHVTDDTFAERPAVLSGAFGPGVLVATTYREVSDALVREQIRFLALTARGAGMDCGGPVISADVGRGFHGPFGGEPALPERTGGEAWDLRAMRDGTFDLVGTLRAALLRLACSS